MTREEAAEIIDDECEHIKQHIKDYTFQSDNGKGNCKNFYEFYIKLENLVIAFNMASKALKQEPCEVNMTVEELGGGSCEVYGLLYSENSREEG